MVASNLQSVFIGCGSTEPGYLLQSVLIESDSKIKFFVALTDR